MLTKFGILTPLYSLKERFYNMELVSTLMIGALGIFVCHCALLLFCFTRNREYGIMNRHPDFSAFTVGRFTGLKTARKSAQMD